MLKKVLCGVLVCAIMSAQTSDFNVIAYANEEEVVTDSLQGKTIDELYSIRSSLSLEFDKNKDEIEEIDKRLEQLGVEEISQSEVEEKLGIATNNKARISVSSNSNVKWTSARENYVYRGKSYELQVVRGVPTDGTSSLKRTAGTDKVFSASSRFCASAKNISRVIVNSVAGKIPVIGGTLSTLQTFYDVFKNTISGLTSTTMIEPVECTYIINYVTSYKFVFVKYSGDADAGNQILGYVGNDIDYTGQISIGNPVCVNGVWVSGIQNGVVKGNITSPYYNGYRDVASNVFWEYKNGNPNVYTRYETNIFTVQVLDGTLGVEVPYVFPY